MNERGRRCCAIAAVVLALLLAENTTRGEILIGFDQEEYVVTSVDEPFSVQVLIDANDQTPELDPVRGGLFSFGTKFTFDATKAEIKDASDIAIQDDLDHFGLSDGGFIEVSAGAAAGKGNIDQSVNPLEPFAGNLLMTTTVSNKAAPLDEYLLTLETFRTLGPNEQIFLNGSGDSLDDDIVFGTARVRVIPEPTSGLFLALGGVMFLIRYRSRLTRH